MGFSAGGTSPWRLLAPAWTKGQQLFSQEPTMPFSSMNFWQKRYAFDTIRRVIETVRTAVRPGIEGRQVDEMAREIMEREPPSPCSGADGGPECRCPG